MTRAEWIEVLAQVRLHWPHVPLPDEAVSDQWRRELEHLPGDQVKVGIEAIYRDGKEFPPSGAQVLAKVVELGRVDVDHGEAWKLAKTACFKEPTEAARWLEERCPDALEAVRRLCGSSVLTYMNDDEPTVRAQFREIYKGIIEAQKRDDRYAGLPSAGLRGLERGPRTLGSALKRALPERAA